MINKGVNIIIIKQQELPNQQFLARIGGKKMEKFSVLMSVYFKEKPEYLDLALESVFNQTIKPYEVVLVVYGKLIKERDRCIERCDTE